MKKQTFIVFLLFVLWGTSCIKDKNPFDGNGDNHQTIPSTMPQTDIPWPSLASSPWPMSHRTAQCVARTHLIGPRTGEIQWQTSVPRGKALCPPVIGEDGTIYVSVNVASYGDLPPSGLYAVSSHGEIKWKFPPPHHLNNEQFDGSPMVGADGTIYVASWGAPGLGFFYALNPDGTVKWMHNLEEESVEGGNNIGSDGILYTVTKDGYLHAINTDGSLKWKSYGTSGFQSEPTLSISISPNGQTLYLGGQDRTLNAVNAADGKEIWKRSTGLDWNRAPLIDFQGNIYCQAVDTQGQYIFSLDSDGNERWRYRLSTSVSKNGYGSDFVMDWDGFLYFFYGEQIYSLNYAGNLRWKREFGGPMDVCPLLCDGENIIYGLDGTGLIKGFSQDGSLRFQITLMEAMTTIGAIGENGMLYCTSGETAIPCRYNALFAIN